MKGYRLLKVIRRDNMSSKGLSHWSRKLRKRVYKYVFRSLGDKYVPLVMAQDRKDFSRWLKENYGYGYFYICSWRMKIPKGGTKPKPTPYRIAIIEITQTESGENYIPSYVDMTRMSREKWFEPKGRARRKLEREGKLI